MKMKPWRITYKGEILVYPPGPDDDITGGAITFTTQEGSQMGEITVKAEETALTATVQFTDAKGNVTPPDVTPTWTVGDETILSVTPADDGLSATFGVVGGTGACAVTVETQETHDGVGDPTDIILTGLVTVIAGDTVAGSITFTTATTPTPPDEPVQLPNGGDGGDVEVTPQSRRGR